MTIDIDLAATRRRIEQATSGALHRLDQCAERSAEFDRKAQETIAKQDQHLKDSAEARARAAEAERADEAEKPPSWGARAAKPTYLRFDAEDAAPEPPRPAPVVAPAPVPPPAPEPGPTAHPERVLSFGLDDERAEPPPRAARQPNRRLDEDQDEDQDDDLSGRSWMR